LHLAVDVRCWAHDRDALRRLPFFLRCCAPIPPHNTRGALPLGAPGTSPAAFANRACTRTTLALGALSASAAIFFLEIPLARIVRYGLWGIFHVHIFSISHFIDDAEGG